MPFPAVAPQNLPQYPNAQFDPTVGEVVPAIPTQQLLTGLNQGINTLGQGVVNQVRSLGTQMSTGLMGSMGQATGTLAQGVMGGLGSGIGNLGQGLLNPRMRIAGRPEDSGDAGFISPGGGGGGVAARGLLQEPASSSSDAGSSAGGSSSGSSGGAGDSSSGGSSSSSGVGSSASGHGRSLQQVDFFANPAAGLTDFVNQGVTSGNFGTQLGTLAGSGGDFASLMGGDADLGSQLQAGLAALSNSGAGIGGSAFGGSAGGGLANAGGGAGGWGNVLMQMTGLGGGNADVFNTGSAGGLSGLSGLLQGHKQQQSSSNAGGGFGHVLSHLASAFKPGGGGSSSGGGDSGNAAYLAQAAGLQQQQQQAYGGSTAYNPSPYSNPMAGWTPEQGMMAQGAGGGTPPGTQVNVQLQLPQQQQQGVPAMGAEQYRDAFNQLTKLPGQAVGSLAGYGAGLASQGYQTTQQLANNVFQQAGQAMAAGNPVLGGNNQPIAVPGVGQDPNTYMIGGSDYYPGGSNGFGQAGQQFQQAGGRTAPGLVTGQLVPATTRGNQFGGGSLGSGGQFISQPTQPGGVMDPATGQFSVATTSQSTAPNSFYWSGGYWGYCPPPAPIIAAPAPAVPVNPGGVLAGAGGGTLALIRSPQAQQEFVTSDATGLAPVLLDASGTQAGAGRTIAAYGWVVKSAADGAPRATGTGSTITVLLPPGRYVATLNAVDNTGFSSTAGPQAFTVQGPGPRGPNPLGSMSTAVMAARIASPPPIVSMGTDGQNVSINLDGTGSTPSPGQQLQSYAWTVTAQLGGVPVVYFQEVVQQATAAFVSLPVGSYIVNLIVRDTAGRNASITQNFVVAGGSQNGTIAVVTLPLSYVRGSPGASTTVTLDAQNSSPRPGTSLTQWVWAVITQPDKRAVANATGRITQLRLKPGLYQVGLLVVDSNGGNAIAQKNVEVGPPQADARKQPRPPIIPTVDGPLEAEAGGELLLPAITDPNNDVVNVVWTIRQNGQLVKEGTGGSVTLDGVAPGTYVVEITADDGVLTSTGSYDLRVRKSGDAAPPARPPGSKPPAARPPASGGGGDGGGEGEDGGGSGGGGGGGSGGLDLDLRLPSLTLSQGATLEIDAGSTGIPVRDLGKYTYKWVLRNKATGQTVTTQEGQSISLPLTNADSLQLQLVVSDPGSDATATGSSNLKVLPRPEGADPLPVVAGSCGPFKSNPGATTKLTCSGKVSTQASDGEPSNAPTVWAWRITRLSDQSITTAVGSSADFGRLEEGSYVVEAAVGASGPPTSTNTIYFLSTYLTVSSSSGGSGGSGGGSKTPAKAPAKAPGSSGGPGGGAPAKAAARLQSVGGGGGGQQHKKQQAKAKKQPQQQLYSTAGVAETVPSSYASDWQQWGEPHPVAAQQQQQQGQRLQQQAAAATDAAQLAPAQHRQRQPHASSSAAAAPGVAPAVKRKAKAVHTVSKAVAAPAAAADNADAQGDAPPAVVAGATDRFGRTRAANDFGDF